MFACLNDMLSYISFWILKTTCGLPYYRKITVSTSAYLPIYIFWCKLDEMHFFEQAFYVFIIP